MNKHKIIHNTLLASASILTLIILIFAIHVLNELQNIAESDASTDPANIAWQYSLLIAEYHRFDHQLDRTILIPNQRDEITTLGLRYRLLKDRIAEAEKISLLSNKTGNINLRPFTELKRFMLAFPFLEDTELQPINTQQLNDITREFYELSDEITAIALNAAQLTSESNNQKRRNANLQSERYITILALLALIVTTLVLISINHIFFIRPAKNKSAY